MCRSITDLREAGYLDSGLISVSDTQSLVDAVMRLTLEDGGAFYDPERGILTVSFLKEETSPCIEVYNYRPVELAALVASVADVTVSSDIMDIQDVVASMPSQSPSHIIARFDTVHDLEENDMSPFWQPRSSLLDLSGHEGLNEANKVYDRYCAITVRKWYMAAYPDDELGAQLDANLTFDEALAAVPTGNGFYSALGVGDSLARERIFEEMSRRFDYDYDDLYDSWLHQTPLEDRDILLKVKYPDGLKATFRTDEAGETVYMQDTETGDLISDNFFAGDEYKQWCCHIAAYGTDPRVEYVSSAARTDIAAAKEELSDNDISEKVAVAAGYRFNLVDKQETSGIELRDSGTMVTVDGKDYPVMKGASYAESCKVDALLDSHGDKPIADFRKQVSLKEEVQNMRAAAAALHKGSDDPDLGHPGLAEYRDAHTPGD